MQTLKIYKSGNGYIGKLDISKLNVSKLNQDLVFIIILDVSGSMGQTVPRFVNIILPNLLQKLDITSSINLITFSDEVKIYKGDYNYFSTLELKAYGCTYMNKAIDELEKIFLKINKKTNIRILSISDGELHDQEQTVEKASNLYNKFKEYFIVNSQAVRLYTSSSEPETKGMSSLMQFSNITEPKLIDIQADKDLFNIADEICALFNSDGLGCNLYVKSNENVFMENPWSEPNNELRLIIGENIFWLNKLPDKVELFNINNNILNEIKIEICENITIKNYQNILENKIKFFYQKLKVLKVVNTEEASIEINKIINYFDTFENMLNLQNIDNEVVLKDSEKYKISNRAFLLKKLIQKRNISISHKMKEIQNNDKVSQLNAKQLADFLRNLDLNKESKSLARRGLKESIDFDSIARNEVLNMMNHIQELNDIDDSNHNVSFYSASTTLEGIKSLCELAQDNSVLNSMTAIDIIKLLNIVGVGCEAPIGDYTDPMQYRLSDIYIGCYVSLSDILTASEFNGGKDNLVDFNTKKIITNVIPFYDDIRIHNFLIKYAPKLLEYTASIGMRRLLIEVPYTYEFLIEAGIWKFSEVLNNNRSEAAINIYTKLIQNYEIASKGHYDFLINIVLKQADYYKKNPSSERNNYHIYLNDNSIVNMTSVFLSLLQKNETEVIKKMCRELFCHGVHKVVNKLIKKNENKNEFIKTYIEELLGINYEKFGNDLPELFEENQINDFYDKYNINMDKLNEFYKISFRSMFIPMTPLYLNATLQQDKKKAFEELPLYNEENIIKALGINFDLNHFKLFAVIQAFLFRTNEERIDTKEKIMKIIDIGNYDLAEKMVKDYVKTLYRENYDERLNMQKKTENEMLENELIDKMEKSDTMEEYVKLIKEGIKRGVRTCKMDGISNSVFIKLKKDLIENGENIPLINTKIAVLVLGYYKEEKVFNNGNIYRGFMDFKDVICNKDEQYWNKLYKYISKKRRRHVYRELENRQGHSNDKPSYWALGYKSIEEMFNTISKVEIEEYKKVHSQCCGLGNKRNRPKKK